MSVSGVVALIQVINFFEARHAKAEANKAVFAKANDVRQIFDTMKKEVSEELAKLKEKTERQTEDIHDQEVDISILKTQVAGFDKSLDHIIDTLDSIITRISEEK
jgi:hypothetical protein